jgi:hypothetical protein
LALLLAGCGSSGETRLEAAVDDFVTNWVSGAPLCDEQAICGLEPPGPCSVALRPAEEIEEAVRYAHLDIGALYRCQRSLDQFVGCLTTLDCSTLPFADVRCAGDHERYAIDCAAFLEALTYLDEDGSGGGASGGSGGQAAGGAPASGGGGAPGAGGVVGTGGTVGAGGIAQTGGTVGTGGVDGTGGGFGGTQAALAEVLCDRAEVCTGLFWPSEEKATCQAEAAALFGPLVPDPPHTSACLSAAPCQEIASGLAALVVECVDLDRAESRCTGGASLSACTFAGVCSEYSCREVCGTEGLITTGCGPSRAGGDTCLCTQ